MCNRPKNIYNTYLFDRDSKHIDRSQILSIDISEDADVVLQLDERAFNTVLETDKEPDDLILPLNVGIEGAYAYWFNGIELDVKNH